MASNPAQGRAFFNECKTFNLTKSWRIMKTTIRFLSIFGILIALNGCATPLGQHYGNLGGLAGAVIGGAAGGWRGAIIGGAAGVATGGLYGDAQSRQWYEDQRNAYPDEQSYRNNRYNDRRWKQDRSYGYVEPCTRVWMPIYDRNGYVVGRRLECQ